MLDVGCACEKIRGCHNNLRSEWRVPLAPLAGCVRRKASRRNHRQTPSYAGRTMESAAGQSATASAIGADATIYRASGDYLTVAKDGTVLSYVKNATPGDGVALRYTQLGGK
jgi:hypothetical protein